MILVPKENILPNMDVLRRKLHIKRAEEEELLSSVLLDAISKLSPMYSFRKIDLGEETIKKISSKSEYLRENIKGASEGLLVICTLGEDVSKSLRVYQEKNDLVSALYLDTFLNDTVENLASYLARELFNSFYLNGSEYKLGKRLGPGYGDINLDFQRDFFSFFEDEKMEVSLNESYYMQPEKSISYLVPVIKR